MSSRPHAVVVSYPAQGHVNPLMDLSRIMAERGFKITSVNTEFPNNRIRSAIEADMNDSLLEGRIRLVSIPDGLGPEEDRSDLNKLFESILRDMPCMLEELIHSVNGSDGNTDEMITCVVADLFMGWAPEVATKMGIRSALFWIGSATTFALKLSIPWLIHEGIINGITKGQTPAYPHGFQGTQGKIVDWAPQKRVLSHPAIACFLSHCGWNSVMEGLSNGVPFFCWPQFADHFLIHAYVCDVWKVGLRLDRDENGIIRREEFKKKVEQFASFLMMKNQGLCLWRSRK
ncbi:hypothetical protein L1049_012508 [Liquidambar formosana]|uniref:Uncharacterized protein n=1 Tax=Liquidambar formosana TaxID=63359 RepID=A0AAP0N768_LIQFO